MGHVTDNYLEGEQRICDVWAQYINSRSMTMDEAAAIPMEEPIFVKLDRPFIYAIVDDASGVPVFLGAQNSMN